MPFNNRILQPGPELWKCQNTVKTAALVQRDIRLEACELIGYRLKLQCFN